jgi:hypothetical protein
MKTLQLNGNAIVFVTHKNGKKLFDNTGFLGSTSVSLVGDVSCIENLAKELVLIKRMVKDDLNKQGLKPKDFDIKIELQGSERVHLSEGSYAAFPQGFVENEHIAILTNVNGPEYTRESYVLNFTPSCSKKWDCVGIKDGMVTLLSFEDINKQVPETDFNLFMKAIS